MRIVLLLVASAVLLAGCGADGGGSPTAGVDLIRLVTVLPTPAGLDQATSRIRPADAALVQATFAGVARPESATAFEARGFRDGAIRTWSGEGGARLVVVVSRWPDHLDANAAGAGAAEFPLEQGERGARAWNPREISGARGSRVDAPGASSRSLAFAIDDVSLFVRGEGPVADAAVIRTLELLTLALT